MRKKIIILLEKIHILIFGHSMSDTMKSFIYNLSWSIIGYFFSGLIIYTINIIMGRVLGPEEFGKYSLILVIATFSSIIMFFGLDSTSIKFISHQNTKEQRNKSISNSVIFITATSLLFLIIFLLFTDKIAYFLQTSNVIIQLGLVLGLIITFRTLFDNIIKSMGLFKLQSAIKVFEAIFILLLVVGLLMFVQNLKIYSFYSIFAVTYIFSVTIILKKVKINIRSWDKVLWSKMFVYWKAAVVISLISILINTADRFFIFNYLGPSQLGIYTAYLLSSTVIVGQFATALLNVLFPSINMADNKKVILKKIDTLTRISFFPLLLIFSLLSIFTMKLFGSKYELDLFYVVLVSFISYLQIIIVFYGSIMSSSADLLNIGKYFAVFKPSIFIIAYLLLIHNPKFISITTFFILTIISYMYEIIGCRICFRKI